MYDAIIVIMFLHGDNITLDVHVWQDVFQKQILWVNELSGRIKLEAVLEFWPFLGPKVVQKVLL